MSTVSTEISKYMGPATKLAEIWGSILYNVKDTQFAGGAKGNWNGTSGADDTAAIQACINAAIAAGVKTVFFPSGTYLSAALTNTSQVILTGDNAKFTGISNFIYQFSWPSADKGNAEVMTYNSTPVADNLVHFVDGDSTNPSTRGTTPSVYIQRVDQSVTSDDSAHLIPALYVTMKRKAGGKGWLYSNLNYLEDASNTGAAQSVASAGMIYMTGNSQGWGVYGDATKVNTLATTTGAEFDSTNTSGVDDLYNYANPLISGHSKALWVGAGGTNKSSFAFGIGGAGQTQGCGIFMAQNSITDYGIDIQAQPSTLINFKNGAKTGASNYGIGLDCGAGALYTGTGANKINTGAIHLRGQRLCFGNGGYMQFNGVNLEIGTTDAAGVDTRRAHLDVTNATGWVAG
jgi:hypothetical protein